LFCEINFKKNHYKKKFSNTKKFKQYSNDTKSLVCDFPGPSLYSSPQDAIWITSHVHRKRAVTFLQLISNPFPQIPQIVTGPVANSGAFGLMLLPI